MLEVKQHTMFTNLLLFLIAAFGTFLNRRNLIIMLLCIEIMLLAVTLNLCAASFYLGHLNGLMMILFVLTSAAAETAIGLALCVVYYQYRDTLDVEYINMMRG
jgi:NADH-quinone oxidoreductase subunit K